MMQRGARSAGSQRSMSRTLIRQVGSAAVGLGPSVKVGRGVQIDIDA